MGYTVSTNRVAAAFKGQDGKTVWCLFEKTYDGRTYPHSPDWSCVAIGDIHNALRTVFGIARDCEGGMLKGNRGDITPEEYIGRWMTALRNPRSMPDCAINAVLPTTYAGIYAGESGNYWVSEERERSNVALSRLDDVGRGDLAEALLRARGVALDVPKGARIQAPEPITLRLHADSVAVCALFGEGAIAPYNGLSRANLPALDSAEFNAARCVDLAYRPRPDESEQGEDVKIGGFPQIRRIGKNDDLLVNEDGQWKEAGWDYAVVGRYVANLWKTEIESPGSYATRIAAFREHVKSAPMLSLGSMMLVDLDKTREGHGIRDEVRKRTAQLGGSIEGNIARIPCPSQAGDMGASDAGWFMVNCRGAIDWEVAAVPEQENARPVLECDDEDEATRDVGR